MDTRVIVIMGERWSGKSTLGRLLRDYAEVGSEADLEFSDFMIKATNFALGRRARSRRRFPLNLFEGANWVLDMDLGFPGSQWFMRRESPQREHRSLLGWLDVKAASDLRLDRQNKLEHLPPLIWQGYFIRHPELAGPDAWGRLMVKTVRPLLGRLPLVTVAGARDPGDVVPIKRAIPGAVTVRVEREAVRGDLDSTNRHHHLVRPDVVVNNNGSLAELDEAAAQLAGRDLIDRCRGLSPLRPAIP